MMKHKEDYEAEILAERLWQVSQEAFDYGSPWEASQFLADIVNQSSHYLLLEDKDQVIGYVVFHVVLDEAEVINVAILPKYRGQGLAKKLLRVGLSEIIKLGVETVFLEVRETNYPALTVYLTLGFEEIGRRKAYYHQPKEDGLVMRWQKNKGV